MNCLIGSLLSAASSQTRRQQERSVKGSVADAKTNRLRDPIHGYIELSQGETQLVDTAPFQRLRNIRQLGMTYEVYPGAEHTRFGHSLGVMHLTSRAFDALIERSAHLRAMPEERRAWYRQILRLIGLTHDLGHAPFSHAAEQLFPEGASHEEMTERIIRETEVADCIRAIGSSFQQQYGTKYSIEPRLISEIYLRGGAELDPMFPVLRALMDGELDCDKMDYLLRDSYYCGVTYGSFDLERLIKSLITCDVHGLPKLALDSGGTQAFEQFVVARYHMFNNVYFHRTRRMLDINLTDAIMQVLPGGRFPSKVDRFLRLDDVEILSRIRRAAAKSEACAAVVNRTVHTCVLEMAPHPNRAQKQLFKVIRKRLYRQYGSENFLEDDSATKMPHMIPVRTEVDDEYALNIVNNRTGEVSTISDDSPITRALSNEIDMRRLYCKNRSIVDNVRATVQEEYQVDDE